MIQDRAIGAPSPRWRPTWTLIALVAVMLGWLVALLVAFVVGCAAAAVGRLFG